MRTPKKVQIAIKALKASKEKTPDLAEFRDEFAVLRTKVEILWRAREEENVAKDRERQALEQDIKGATGG